MVKPKTKRRSPVLRRLELVRTTTKKKKPSNSELSGNLSQTSDEILIESNEQPIESNAEPMVSDEQSLSDVFAMETDDVETALLPQTLFGRSTIGTQTNPVLVSEVKVHLTTIGTQTDLVFDSDHQLDGILKKHLVDVTTQTVRIIFS